MDVGLLLLDVQKVYGLGSVMILDVSICVFDQKNCVLTMSLAMRRVLHLKMVTQCAMLEDFGIFLVLADKVDILIMRSCVLIERSARCCLPITLKHWYLHHQRAHMPHKHLRNSVETRTFISSVLVHCMVAHWSFI
jgi:hypothetical protein